MGSSNKKHKKMTNEPILKNSKMNINQLTTTNYINSRPIGQKKTNPFKAKPKPCVASREAGSSTIMRSSIIKHKKMTNKPKVKFWLAFKPFNNKHFWNGTLS
jgi:hypothetical protein